MNFTVHLEDLNMLMVLPRDFKEITKEEQNLRLKKLTFLIELSTTSLQKHSRAMPNDKLWIIFDILDLCRNLWREFEEYVM